MYARLARGKASSDSAPPREPAPTPRIPKPKAKPTAPPRAKPQARTLDFSHLRPAPDVDDRSDPAAQAAFIVAAAAKARTPTAAPPAGSTAAKIIAAGRQRRGEIG